MATFRCSDAIDRALRTRTATLPGMYEALRLTGNRIGNPERMRLLLDSRARSAGRHRLNRYAGGSITATRRVGVKRG